MRRPRWTEGLGVELEQPKQVPSNNWKGFYWTLGVLWAVPIWLDAGITLTAFLMFPTQIVESGPFFGILYRISPGLFTFSLVMFASMPFFTVGIIGRRVHWQFNSWFIALLLIGIGNGWWRNFSGFTQNLAELGRLS